ncbi:MAG: tRNA epoxyqueuosine(34) reductase QueG [Terracidiphilus sp.]
MPNAIHKPLLNSAAGKTTGLPACLSWELVRALALEAGFDEAGVVALPHANQERDAERFEEWVQAGHAGTMRYLERRDEAGQLLRARIPFPWARTAVVCFANYNSSKPRSMEPSAEGAGWIARYAWSSKMEAGREGTEPVRRPSDYHKVLLKRMKAVESRLHEQFGEFEARSCVDTGPVVERALATAAGLGWTGKNTCLINPRLGSFGFLAVLLTSLEIEKEKAPLALVPDHCGSCRRCLEACPTGALTAPYQMDANKCISYLTIEHRGDLLPELMKGMGRQVFGCDICQDVCPWNRKAPVSADPELEPRPELVNPTLEWLAAMDEAEFARQFNGSPVRRAGFWGLRRNVAIAMGNSGMGRFAPLLKTWSEAADEGLRSASRWALGKLSSYS